MGGRVTGGFRFVGGENGFETLTSLWTQSIQKESVLSVHVPVYRLAVRWLILGGLTSDKYARPFQTRDSKMSSLRSNLAHEAQLFSIEIPLFFPRARNAGPPGPQRAESKGRGACSSA